VIFRLAVLLLMVALAGVLAWAVLAPASPQAALAAGWRAALPETGASHPVTAVLLGFRAYDTLLEMAVLLLAVLGANAAAGGPPARPAPLAAASPVLRAFVNTLVPVMLLVAAYFLWAGTRQPGGAFQAGAVLGATGVLLRLGGELPALDPERPLLRIGLAAGLAVFLGASLAAVPRGLPWLRYPPEAAGATLFLVESALTVSIGLALVSLFASARR
jgi:multisubunit Na+/H+ antiporter MnhB subunit